MRSLTNSTNFLWEHTITVKLPDSTMIIEDISIDRALDQDLNLNKLRVI